MDEGRKKPIPLGELERSDSAGSVFEPAAAEPWGKHPEAKEAKEPSSFVAGHLAPDKRRLVEEYGRSFFAEQFERLAGFSPAEIRAGDFFKEKFGHRVIEDLARILSNPSDIYKFIDFEMQAALVIFNEQLLNFVKDFRQKSGGSKEEKIQLENFAAKLETKMYSASPTIASYLPAGDLLRVAAAYRRDPDLKDIGQRLVENLTYNLSFSGSDLRELVADLKTKDISEVLDIVSLIDRIAGQGLQFGDWAQGAVEKTRLLLRSIKENFPHPLVQDALAIAEDRLSANERYYYSEDEAAAIPGDLREREKEGIEIRKGVILENLPKQERYILFRVARDAVAVFDKKYIPRGIGKMDFSQSRPVLPPEFSAADFPALAANLDLIKDGQISLDKINSAGGTMNPLSRLVPILENDIFQPAEKMLAKKSQRPEFWHELVPTKDADWWQEYWDNKKEIDDVRQAVSDEIAPLQKELDTQMLALDNEFLRYFLEQAPADIERSGVDSSWAKEEYERVKRHYEQGEKVKAYEIASRMAESINPEQYLDLQQHERKQTPYKIEIAYRETAAKGEDLSEQFMDKADKIRSEYYSLIQQANNRFQEQSKELDAIAKEAAPGIKQKLNELEAELKEKGLLAVLQVLDYEKLIADRQTNPFNNSADEDLVLLLGRLHDPELSGAVGKDLGVDMRELDLKTQVYLLRFLARAETDEYKRAARVSSQTPESDRLNFLNSFLATSENVDYGTLLLDIADNLKENEPAAAKLFSAVADFTGNIQQKITSILEAHQLIFTESQIENAIVVARLLARPEELLFNARESLRLESTPDKSSEIISDLVESFKNEQESLERQVAEFSAAAKEVRNKLQDISRMLEEQPDPAIDSNYFYREFFDPRAWKQDKTEWVERLRKTMPGGPIPEDMQAKILHVAEQEITERPRYATSERISRASEDLQESLKEFDDMYGRLKTSGEENDARSSALELYRRAYEDSIKPIYIRMIKELGELLKFQKAFEAKFQHLATGEKEASLPRGFLDNLEKETANLSAERLPQEEPFYFPVGISSNLPEWREVLAGEKQAAKPIDIYAYLFWLNNQGKKAELVVVDEIQATNYQSKYGVNQEEATDWSRAIGQRERETYQKIIDVFGLSNIAVRDYSSFRQERAELISNYKELCQTLLAEPVFKNAFSRLVPESISGEQEKEQYLAYALEEVSWILAVGGAKVSHQNEAGYDALAAFIAGAEAFSKTAGKSLGELARNEKERQLFTAVLNGAHLKLKNKLDRDRLPGAKSIYLDKAYNVLSAIGQDLKKGGKISIMPSREDMKKANARFNFVAPQAASQSFGWRGRGGKGEEPALKFREPYSTYFYKDGAEIFLGSEQVVASPDGLVGGKVLALPDALQQKYAVQVLKPLLLQYFKALEVAPAAYFEQVGKDRRELLRECQKAASALDVIKFIQKYVVGPTAVSQTAREKAETSSAEGS